MKKVFESAYDYTLEDYVEYLKDMDELEEGKEYREDEDFYDWRYRTQENDMDDFWHNIAFSSHKGAFIITGTLGLWDGHPEIRPVICNNIKQAVEKCVFSGGIEEFEMFYDNGGYVIYAHHHDGTNVFQLYELTENGERIAREKEDEYGFHLVNNWIKKIKKDDCWLY